MNLATKRSQRGATLLVGMIMMVVLTLLVVFAIRSGNTNLRIAGNMQVQAETAAATQQAIEQVIEQIKDTEDISLIAAQNIAVSMGNVTYTVAVQPLNNCIMQIPVLNETLDFNKPNDVVCYEGGDSDKPIIDLGTGEFKTVAGLSACKTQQWEIEASVTDNTTGATASQVQGITIRVPSTVPCT